MKIHAAYLTVILLLVIALCRVGYPLYFDSLVAGGSADEQYSIEARLEMIHPETRQVIATFEPGFPFIKPRYHDLIDAGEDINVRLKLLLDMEGIVPRSFSKTKSEWRASPLRLAETTNKVEQSSSPDHSHGLSF